MIDKTQRRATVERNGSIVAVRMRGGPDCLWLDMYLDVEDWQMTCDSDVGFYAYHWGRRNAGDNRDFIEFCVGWLSNEEWLLRKCVDEQRVERKFDREQTMRNLRRLFAEQCADDAGTYALENAFDMASEYSDAALWVAALVTAADCLRLHLPEEWYEYIVEDYTPWQKRFAEICREVIAPALKGLKEDNCNG